MPHRTWKLDEVDASTGYDLMTNLIVPRPIAFVSTLSAEGEPNLAPFSFFMLGGPDPPSIAICPIRDKDGNKKATLRNLEATSELTVNLVTRAMAEGMNQTGVDYANPASKWGLSGFTAAASERVKPDRVAESPVQMECRVHQIVEHGESSYVIAEVLAVHVEESLIDPESGKASGFMPIARLGGAQYIDLDGGKVFEMRRPKADSRPSVEL